MNATNFAKALLVTLPLAAVIACGGSSTESTGAGGNTTTSSTTTTTTSSGTGGTASTSSTSTSSSTGATTTSSSTTTSSTSTSTGSTTSSSSSSTTSSSSGTAGACTDAADMAVNMTTVGNDASGCVESNCLTQYLTSNWSGLTTCVASCLQTKDAITTGCAACWGAVVSCGAQHCASQCANGQSTACTTCTDQYCTPAFNTCAGS